MVSKGKGIAANTPTELPSSGKKKKRTDTEGAEQRGRIYSKLGMGERNPQTGVQMAKIKEGRTFEQFMVLAEMRKEDKVKGKQKTPLNLDVTHKTVRRSPEGKWERQDITVKRPNPAASMGRYSQGIGHRPEFGTTGGSGYGYKPQPHGTGGELRGKRKVPGEKKAPKWEPGVDSRTPAKKVADRRAKAAYTGYDYRRGTGYS
jgi:hypothetical protein